MVTSSTADLADRLVKREPVLAVEVLSPSSAAFDRGDTVCRLPATAQPA